MSKVWFTSDTHFGSERTLKLSKRPFKTVKEMDETIINNWNSIVSKEDTIYHLGDFGDFNKAKELNGNIILISGNYDDKVSDKEILDSGIKKVIREFRYETWINNNNSQFKYDKYYIQMSHYPSHLDEIFSLNTFNLFGHIHKLQMVKEFGLNVGIDCHNFYPIDLDTVLFYRNAIDKFYDDEVFR